MKKVIDGIRYDTEKATHIGNASSVGLSRSDFRWWDEDLYKSPRTDRFFLHGEGGAMSQWARSIEGGRARIGGEGIKPISKEQARTWCEENLDGEEWEQYFADIIQDA